MAQMLPGFGSPPGSDWVSISRSMVRRASCACKRMKGKEPKQGLVRGYLFEGLQVPEL